MIANQYTIDEIENILNSDTQDIDNPRCNICFAPCDSNSNGKEIYHLTPEGEMCDSCYEDISSFADTEIKKCDYCHEKNFREDLNDGLCINCYKERR